MQIVCAIFPLAWTDWFVALSWVILYIPTPDVYAAVFHSHGDGQSDCPSRTGLGDAPGARRSVRHGGWGLISPEAAARVYAICCLT
jgi:hypothetical protein